MHLYVGSKVNTKPLCVEQPTVSTVKDAELDKSGEGGTGMGNRTGVESGLYLVSTSAQNRDILVKRTLFPTGARNKLSYAVNFFTREEEEKAGLLTVPVISAFSQLIACSGHRDAQESSLQSSRLWSYTINNFTLGLFRGIQVSFPLAVGPQLQK